MTTTEIIKIIQNIKYKRHDHRWVVCLRSDKERNFIQVMMMDSGLTGRKWALSPHMTKSEVVQTIFKALVTCEEHEAREGFLYKNEPVFGPHFDVDDLVSLASMKHFNVRAEIKPTKLGENNETK